MVRDGLAAAIDDADQVLGAMAPSETSPAIALMRSSIEGFREELQEQLSQATRAQLRVVLDGTPVVRHRIRVDALSKVLHSLQEVVSAVGQALVGRATSSSSIPGPLRDRTALSFAAAVPGSFGAVLEGPEAEQPGQGRLAMTDHLERDTLLNDSLERVLKIINLAGDNPTDDAPVIDEVLPLGSRAFKHLNTLSTTIVDEGMTARFTWLPTTGDGGFAELNESGARRLGDILGRNRATEEQVVEHGRLGTISDIRNRIELDTGDRVIQAQVVEELVPRLGDFFARRVAATFDVSVVRSLVTGTESRAYTLVALTSVDAEE
ncbi:hypothetical protein [Pseudonocardia sp. NPDC049635]|uniref:hypothetical protein n=1 Tax=Pseudonocardia sp. NPDC049635 TaxID=3155506 RepID=UPI0033CFCC2E